MCIVENTGKIITVNFIFFLSILTKVYDSFRKVHVVIVKPTEFL